MSGDERYHESGEPPTFEDRSTGLIVFGAIQVLIGAGCAMLIPLMLLALKANPQADARSMIPAVGFYGLISVVSFTLGTGSMLGRRWARALTLVIAWTWLVVGVVSLIFVALMMPAIFNPAAQDPKIPREMLTFIGIMTLGVLGFVYVLVPGIFVLFYQSKHVKATCEFKDPQLRWTDKCPLPVLALSLLLGFAGYSILSSFSYGPVLPFFGVILKGWPAGLGILGVTLIFAALAWGIYKLKIGAWWGSLIMYLGFGLSNIITFTLIDTIELYKAMEMPEEQLELMQKSGMLERMNIPLLTALGVVGLVLYQLWIRRYFVKADAVAASTDNTDLS